MLTPEIKEWVKRQKPQISLTPGVSIKEKNHYRVTLAGEVLGDGMTLFTVKESSQMTNLSITPNYSEKHYNSPRYIQLDLFPLRREQKPQITSIPGISPKVRNRYRVTLGERILGDELTLNQAVKLAKRGEA